MPISELLPTTRDSDLTLFFLSANDISFTSEVDDSWYAAHRFAFNFIRPPWDGHSPAYLSDDPASVLGCSSHYEACSSESPSDCVVSGGALDLTDPATTIKGEAYSTITYITTYYQDVMNVVYSLMTSSLTARHGLYKGAQGPLPDNQWQSEVEFWHNISLVSLQNVVNSAIGPDDLDIKKYFWQAPDSFQREKFCQNQKIRSSSYTNFSVLGLVITLILGGIIIIVGYTLEQIIELFDTHVRRAIKYSRLEWTSNDILQTQRMAHEELGLGTWDGCVGASTVPVTQKGELLAALDVSDSKHPRLHRPSIAGNDEDIDGKLESCCTAPVGIQSEEQSDSMKSSNNDHQNASTEPDSVEAPHDNHEHRSNGTEGADSAETPQDDHQPPLNGTERVDSVRAFEKKLSTLTASDRTNGQR
ncbi:MAG: hypothetical protein Q9227_002781 [Pyrenula ochraceoflavens]